MEVLPVHLPMAVENRQGNLLNILILITKYLYWLQSVTTVSDEDLLETPKWRIIKRFLRSQLNSDKMVKTQIVNWQIFNGNLKQTSHYILEFFRLCNDSF